MSRSTSCDIVISGISGRFPKANNVTELSDNLYNKVDMIDDDEYRWKHFNDAIPRRSGKIRNVDKFDASCFYYSQRQINTCDPQLRMLTEHCYEAILDAGISPYSLSGTKTGVFVGSSAQDSKESHVYHRQFTVGNLVSNNQFLLANGISYAFGLNGPSFILDSACSSSGFALDAAFKYIQSGACDAALVCGTQLNLNIEITAGYVNTNNSALDKDGISRPFDADAAGFVRAEAVCAVFLQKAEDAKRVYANLLYTKTNNDGFKTEGMFFPSRHSQKKLLAEFYDEINIDPSTVDFLEAHATGTIAGDPQEAWAVDEVFCKNRKKALPIGTIKSNMGHAEAASGMASLAKVILTLENKKIAPNLNFKTARSEITSLVEGRLRVVTETEDLDGPLVAMNCFGIIGANSHALLRGNSKEKINHGVPSDKLNRLVLWSGRTSQAVDHIFDDITKRPLDAEYVALLQNAQTKTFMAQIFRGFGIFKHDEELEKAVCIKRNMQQSSGVKRPIVWVYSGVGSQWAGMGKDLMEIPTFAKSIEKCHKILASKNIDLIHILTTKDDNMFADVLNTCIGIAAIQIGLTDVMRSLGVTPDHIIGHSVGELGCAYADETLTAEETILCAYARGVALKEAEIEEGGMAVIGIELEELKKLLPADIDIACHNTSSLFTISGSAQSVKTFMNEISSKNIFARFVDSTLPYHSRYIVKAGPVLHEKLSTIIKTPKQRSKKWLSTSVAQQDWHMVDNQFASASYFTNNLLQPVLFSEACSELPPNSITIEISPHSLLKAVLKRSMKEAVYIGLTQKSHDDGTLHLMEALGSLFENGVDLDIAKLYPPVDFPVSRGTPMLAPNIKWDHSETFFVPLFDPSITYDKRHVAINIMDRKYEFLRGHEIDGKVLFPGTGYVFLVWETFAMMMGMHYSKVKVQIDELKFLRATPLVETSNLILTIAITKGTNRFEVSEGSNAIATGYIKMLHGTPKMVERDVDEVDDPVNLLNADVNKTMRLKGYRYSGLFNALQEVRSDANFAKIKWNDNWITFLDSMMQIDIMLKPSKDLVLPRGVRKIVIDPERQQEILDSASDGIIDGFICRNLNVIRSGGVEISDVFGYTANRRRPKFEPVLNNYKFVSHFPTPSMTERESIQFCLQLISECSTLRKIKVVEVDSGDGDEILLPLISICAADIPMMNVELHLIASQSVNIDNVTVHIDGNISSFSDATVIIQSKADQDFFDTVQSSVKASCFIMCKLSDVAILPNNFKIVAQVQMKDTTICLIGFNPTRKSSEDPVVIEMASDYEDLSWLSKVQDANEKELPVVLYSQTSVNSGLLGLAKCLRKEPNGDNLTCVLIDDANAPKFSLDHPLYQRQLKLGLFINIYKNGEWGTYRHMTMTNATETSIKDTHCYVDTMARGDFSKITWIKRLNYKRKPTATFVDIHYAALNFRDVMIASGRIEPFGLKDTLKQQAALGLEFSGIIAESGRRVAGIKTTPGGISTSCKTKDAALFDFPDHWSLEEAATVPLVYLTVYLAFFVSVDIRKGKSVLIHAGSGGVGIAAIQVALAYGLTVFTTVSTDEKRNYLLELFPNLNPKNIGNSRDTSFEAMLLQNTKGKGVDFVLNSLSQDKLHASLRCVAENGTFLEIGKYDILNGTNISMGHFRKGITFKPVFLDLNSMNNEMFLELFNNDLKNGIIKPIKANVFQSNQLETAFRFLASGKHVGKVLIDVQGELAKPEDESEPSSPISITPQINFNRDRVHIIVGGLGGFGLELAEWLIQRGAKKLVLNSRRGITAPYQSYKINYWKSYKIIVEVNTFDVTTSDGCKLLIKEAQGLGAVDGIWNLAASLEDGMFINQNEESFMKSLKPKAYATVNLSKVSQELCPELQHFVAFSSVSCGWGNPGQTNYAMGNSILESVIESRHNLGLPAKAIQWGPISEVGLFESSEKNLAINASGLEFQAISSCLQVLDKLLTANDPIVLSMIVAGKQSFDLTAKSAKEIILNVLGIKDASSVKPDAVLGELGMDSLISVEVSQILARDYDVRLSPDAIKFLKLNELEEIVTKKDFSAAQVNPQIAQLFPQDFGEDVNNDELIIELENSHNYPDAKLLIIPGIEGYIDNAWKRLALLLKCSPFILHLQKTGDCATLDEILLAIMKDVKQFFDNGSTFFIVAHSFGSLVALKLVEMLEHEGKSGKLILIDGSPMLVEKWTKLLTPSDSSEENLQRIMASGYATKIINNEAALAEIFSQKTFDLQIAKTIEHGLKNKTINPEIVKNFMSGMAKRMKIALTASDLSVSKLQRSTITLVKASDKFVEDISPDYDLQHYCEKDIVVHTVKGDHLSIIHQEGLVELLNREISAVFGTKLEESTSCQIGRKTEIFVTLKAANVKEDKVGII